MSENLNSPITFLRGVLVFPNMVIHLDVGANVHQCPGEGHDGG